MGTSLATYLPIPAAVSRTTDPTSVKMPRARLRSPGKNETLGFDSEPFRSAHNVDDVEYFEIGMREAQLQQLACNNPVACVAAFRKVVEDLFGTSSPSSSACRRVARRRPRCTKTMDERGKGAFGTCSAWDYVIETNSRDALHIHAQVHEDPPSPPLPFDV